MGLFTLAGSPSVLAQATPVVTPVVSAAEAQGQEAPCVPADEVSTSEELPAGVIREMLFVTEVDSSGFEDPGPPVVPALVGVASVVCIEPETTVSVAVDLGMPTENVSQFYTTSIVALSGDLEIKLVEQCANIDTTGMTPCTVRNGSASFRTGGDRHTSHDLAIGEWTPIPPGSIVVLTDVTVSFRTGDSITRLLTSGVWSEVPPGGTCSSGCGRWRTP
jgi:hypothetical protein